MLECREDAGEYRRPELEHAIYMAERRVLEIQAKLHRWAVMTLIAGSATCSTSLRHESALSYPR